MPGVALALLRRDLLAVTRRRAAWVEPFVFFTVVLVLFPLASDGADATTRAAPAIIWVSVLLANSLALERLLRPDFEDGSLEQLLLLPCPLAVVMLSKVLAYWLVVSLPLVLLVSVYAVLLFLPPGTAGMVVAALAIGTLTVNLVGAVGAALVVTLHRGSLLSGLLTMPLYVPTLVFGARVTAAAAAGLSAPGPLALLGAMLILALVLAPLAAAAALRVTLD